LSKEIFFPNEHLFSFESTEGIVAIEFDGQQSMEVFSRRGDKITSEKEEFQPFILIEKQGLLEERYVRHLIRLEGEHALCFLAFFHHWNEKESILKSLKKLTGDSSNSPDAPFYLPSDPIHQHLLITGKTLFKGLSFNDVHRLQLDIETFCDPEYEFSNPQRESDRITVIALSDSRGFECALMGNEKSEAELILSMIDIIEERDPDVIEGHNIHKFDLSYIQERAKRLKIPLRLGRNKGIMKSHPSRITIAERTINYPRYEIYGRHIVDTWILAQLYDISYRGLESYNLKDIARHFKVASDARTYIPPEKLSWHFDHEPERLRDYALDDVRETGRISEILSYSFFIQAQIFPYSYQNVIVRGNATRIDSLFLRSYLRARHSIPKPSEQKEFEGAYADIFYQGVVRRVIHCDVQSLYPSIMLTFGYYPSSDSLGIFPRLLSDLRDFRVKAKKEMKTAPDDQRARYFDALQSTFKILINSFYGYLGFSFGHFSDFDAAAKVTEKGREILGSMIDRLKARGYIIAEIDTDGIYFSIPAGTAMPEEQEMVKEISAGLPSGILVEIDGIYEAMFSYKIKNYVVMERGGRMVIKGSGLKSRGLERFQRDFMEDMFRLLLSDRKDEIDELFQSYREKIRLHQFPVKMFCKTETLQESPLLYRSKVREKKRNISAAYELALKSGISYAAGDHISYYVAGSGSRIRVSDSARLASSWDPAQPDENTDYYCAKLESLYDKFKPFFKGGAPAHEQLLLIEDSPE
jgi:DNA polymerase, archaea type